MWENNEYRMCFREDSILDFERAMLSSGECSYLLPMMFISSDSKHVVYYDCKGFVPLSRYTVDKTEDALFILEKVLIILSNALGYLITPAKISLSTDTVFYNAETDAFFAKDVAETKNAKGFSRSSISYVHYERRIPGLEKCSDRYAYIVLIGVEEKLELQSPGFYKSERDELLNLRQALPSQFIRPHAQHGWLVRRRKGAGFVKDLKDMVHGVIRIPLEIALDWLGTSKAFSVDSIFPPPAFDTGWRDLMFRDEAIGSQVSKQRI